MKKNSVTSQFYSSCYPVAHYDLHPTVVFIVVDPFTSFFLYNGMTERKTINKYYPPDFDPSKIKRVKVHKESASAALQTVRLMAPFSMRCTTCGEFIYRGKKFNARKQFTGESYLGIKIIRFYIRCPRCSGEIRFKTDPKIADYVTEFGAIRNHDPRRQKEFEDESLDERLERLEREDKEEQEKEELRKLYGIGASGQLTKNGDQDIMEQLEAKVLDTKREMDIQDELDELRTRNARLEHALKDEGLLDKAHGHVTLPADVVQRDQEDAETAKMAFQRTADGVRIKRVSMSAPAPATKSSIPMFKKQVIKKMPNALGVTVKKKKIV